MVAVNYTLYNRSSATATIVEIRFDPKNGINHTADLSNFGGYLSGETGYGGEGTSRPFVSADYVADTSPETAIYVNHFTTSSNHYLVVNSTDRIQSGWTASGNGYASGQTVVTVTSSTWLRMSAAPTSTPTPGQGITFSTPDVWLYVDDTTGISPGDYASGNGYIYNYPTVVTYVVSVDSGSRLTMSDHPDSSPSVGQPIKFYTSNNVGTLAPGSSTTFSVNYTNTTVTLGDYDRNIYIDALVTGAVTKTVRNKITLSNTPAEPPVDYYLSSGGGDGGGPGPADCTDSNSVSCTASGAGGGECFTGDTLINMIGGTTKPIDQIKIGDLVTDALTGQANRVIGIKVTEYEVGRRIFSTQKGVKPYITEQHAFYNENNELCAMSEECEYLAPWLAPVKIVEVPEIETVKDPITVYNLMFETGNSHYANGVPVSNMVGHGGTYVLLKKGFIKEEDYLGYIYHLENTVGLNSLTQEQKAAVFKIVFKLSKYVLTNNNIRSWLLAKAMSWAIRHRTKLYPYLEVYLKSSFRKNVVKRFIK